MSWDKIKEVLGSSAPLIGGLIGGPAGAGIGAIISKSLGTDESPEAIYKELTTNPDALYKIKELELTHKKDLEKMYLDADTQKLKEVNKTYQEELKQESKYVKFWRPTFGYALILTWVLTWFGVVYIIITDVQNAPLVINALVGATTLWSVALAVLGISVHTRSKDKHLMAGFQPKTIIEQLKGK